MKAYDFINSIDHSTFDMLRRSQGDAECRLTLKLALKKMEANRYIVGMDPAPAVEKGKSNGSLITIKEVECEECKGEGCRKCNGLGRFINYV